jgi:uncharacterized damage-inducible protein DinB
MTVHPGMDPADRLARGVAHEFRFHVLEQYVPRIAQCVGMLTPAQVWHRAGANCNSVGNLLLHLDGNVRQWILAGIGGMADRRDRDAEFAANESGHAPHELVARLRATVEEAVRIVDGLSPADLLEVRTFQQRFDETTLGAVLHVMEHFSGHAGQIYAWTKQVTGKDLKFYDL